MCVYIYIYMLLYKLIVGKKNRRRKREDNYDVALFATSEF
jgi:hypothetical protein